MKSKSELHQKASAPEETIMAHIDKPLGLLQKMLEEYYGKYSSGEISEKEYLTLIKPIDEAIDNIEMATLLDSSVLPEAFSKHLRRQ